MRCQHSTALVFLFRQACLCHDIALKLGQERDIKKKAGSLLLVFYVTKTPDVLNISIFLVFSYFCP